MDSRTFKLETSQVPLKVTPGHFATNHAHVNYYLDSTTLKSRQSEARETARALVGAYVYNTVVDTIVCLEGMQVVGAYLADELTQAGVMSRNAHQTIYVVSPEFNSNSQMIFRDNLQPMIKGKNILLLLAVVTTGKTIAKGTLSGVIIAAIIVAMVVLVVFLQGAERRIPVQYSKKIQGKRQFGGANSVIPMKVNTAGVIPVIFAQSLLQTPVIICTLLGKTGGTSFWYKILRGMSQSNWFDPANWVYTIGAVVYVLLIIGFAYFYTSITFNPLEIADNLKRQGGSIPGIRSGKPTSDYLQAVLNHIIFIGAIGLSIVAIIPLVFNGLFGANVSFGGTSIIIIVGVVIETLKQVESQMLVRNYKGFLND